MFLLSFMFIILNLTFRIAEINACKLHVYEVNVNEVKCYLQPQMNNY